jgi:general stress protein YciG
VAKQDRGFASMDRDKQREIASKGGKTAHQKGTAHEWTTLEAREAGRKGGIASHRRRVEETTPVVNRVEPVESPESNRSDDVSGDVGDFDGTF